MQNKRTVMKQRRRSNAASEVFKRNSVEHLDGQPIPAMQKQQPDDDLKKLIAWFDERDPEAEAWLRDMADRIFIQASLKQLRRKNNSECHHRPWE